jgi:hypothetical protein
MYRVEATERCFFYFGKANRILFYYCLLGELHTNSVPDKARCGLDFTFENGKGGNINLCKEESENLRDFFLLAKNRQ